VILDYFQYLFCDNIRFSFFVKLVLIFLVKSSGGQISTKHQKTSIKPFFTTCRLPQYPEFAKNLRSFDGFDQMSAFWSMFWFKSFRNFFGPTIKSGCLPSTSSLGRGRGVCVFFCVFFREGFDFFGV
jgi:hypothetical protein